MASPSSSRADRRRSQRREVTLGGKLFYGLCGLSLDCVVRDISEHGARVAVPSAAWKAPREVHLLSLREGRVYSGQVVWSRGRYLGLDFSRVRTVQDIDEPGLEPLRSAWAAA